MQENEDSFVMYGMQWPGRYDMLTWRERLYIEDYCWLNYDKLPDYKGKKERFFHFKQSVDLKWNRDGENAFVWTEWGEKMIRSYLDNKCAMWGGATSSGKSFVMAAIALTLFCADNDSLILMTSTTLKEAKKRVWGAIQALWRDWMPGSMRTSNAMIVKERVTEQGKKVTNDSVGIHLVAFGDREHALNSILGTKAQGNHPYLLVYDELSELPIRLADAWVANVSLQPTAKIIAASNPTGTNDNPFGKLATPKMGWDYVLAHENELHEWQTITDGVYLRFDGFRNPLITELEEGTLQEDGTRTPITPEREKDLRRIFTPKEVYVSKINEAYGGNFDSPYVRRFFRAIFTQGTSKQAFIDIETLRQSDIHGSFDWKLNEHPVRIASIDPSFTESGDRSVMTIADYGRLMDGRYAINIVEQIVLSVSARQGHSYNYLQAEAICKLLQRYSIKPQHFAVEASGSGVSFCDILYERLHSNAFYRCTCAGSASTKGVAATSGDGTTVLAHNRLSELWLCIRNAIISRQLKGNLSENAIKELTNRLFSDASGKFAIEQKKDYKSRGFKSPDFTDSIAVLIDLCRTRLNFDIRSSYQESFFPPAVVGPFIYSPEDMQPMSYWDRQSRLIDDCLTTRSLH